MRLLTLIILFLIAAPQESRAAENFCEILDGAAIVNEDGKFIGKISNKYESDSIFNRYGNFGSKYNSDSIWNKYGENGSEYHSNSWMNKYSSSPPKIINGRYVIGYLSVNKSIVGALNPIIIGLSCYDFEPQ